MARYYRRRPTRTVARRRREGFIARARGNATLDNATRATVINLLSSYQDQALRDVENCTVTDIRGFWTYTMPDAASVAQSTNVEWIAAGIRTESQRVVSSLDTEAERAATGPLQEAAQYDWWQYIRRTPVTHGLTPIEPASRGTSDYDYQLKYHMQPVRVKSNRKLHSVDESLYMWFQTSGTTPATMSYNLYYDLAIFCRRP